MNAKRYLLRLIVLVWSGFGSFVLSELAAAETPELSADEQTFWTQVEEHFTAWDLDKDGTLTRHEVNLGCINPAVEGKPAAALAAIRLAIRRDNGHEEFTREQIRELLPYRKEPELNCPKFGTSFGNAWERLQPVRRELFAADLLQLDDLHQGRIGNCFFVAALGTITHNRPDTLREMLELLDDGKVRVKFGDGREVVIDPPTHVECTFNIRNGNSGLWAGCFEKAVGTLRLEAQKTPKYETPLDIISRGGSPATALQMLTGNPVTKYRCVPIRDPETPEEEREELLEAMREALENAFAEGRLVVGGTGRKPKDQSPGQARLVKKIVYNHSYAVLAYNRSTDLVTFWNPFGNNFTPDGPPGLENGYLIKNGRFEVPLSEAVQWWGSFSIETSDSEK